jgi:hypothetical protein
VKPAAEFLARFVGAIGLALFILAAIARCWT